MSLTTANQTIVGTCSICSGPVCVPTAYHSIIPPVPKCADCGARAKRNYGAVIPMEQTHKWPSSIVVDSSGGRHYGYSLNPDQISGTWEVPSEQQPGNT